jgi:glycosyltransferase involved in cell wall biosynthesis
MKRRPVLLIAHHFPPENIIGSLRPARFFRYLPEFGYEPYVLTGAPQPEPHPRVVVTPFNRFGIWNRIASRTISPYDDKPSWAYTARQAGAELLQKERFEIILATSPPYSVHGAAHHLAKRFGIPWVADIRDPLTGNASRTQGPLFEQIDAWVERSILKANRVILNTEAALHHWQERYPGHAARFDYLYNGFDPQDLPPSAGPLPARDRQILLHAGSLYNLPYAILLLSALRRLVEKGSLNPDRFQIQFVGSAPDELPLLPDFRFLAERGAAENSFVHVPQAEARQRMRNANVLILLDYYRPDGSLQLPAKIFDYLPVGRPILAVTTPQSPMQNLLDCSGLPHQSLLPTDSPDAAAAKLGKLLALPAGPYPLSPEYWNRFDGRHQTATLAQILDRTIQEYRP